MCFIEYMAEKIELSASFYVEKILNVLKGKKK